jgi:hypothetical protein
MINNIYNTISKTLVKGLVFVALVGVMMSGVTAFAIDYTSTDTIAFVETDAADKGGYINLQNCAVFLAGLNALQGNFISESNDIGPCENNGGYFYRCRKPRAENVAENIQERIFTGKAFVECQRRIGGTNNANTIKSCINLSERGAINDSNLVTFIPKWVAASFYGDGRNISLVGNLETCKPLFAEFCSYMAFGGSNNPKSGKSDEFCKTQLGFTEKPNVAVAGGIGETGSSITGCVKPSAEDITEIKTTFLEYETKKDLVCKEGSGKGVYVCVSIDWGGAKAGKNCTPLNKAAKTSALASSTSTPVAAKDALGGIFSILYKIIGTIIFVLLFIVRYLQMIVLLLFISVMTVLLNLSPNSSLLTSLAVPLWGIFAQIANLGAVAILIYLGSATMIGIMKYDEAIKKGTQVALYTFVASFTYFGLAFMISLLDGFVKLIVYVFGGGSTFKLFEALIGSVSSISKISGAGGSLIPDIGKGFQGAAEVFGKSDTGITTTLIQEIIVVIGLTFILIVFKNVFFMLLTRVAILLLLLITSPLWVLGYLVKDTLPGNLKGQMEKAVELTLNSIVFNFAFVITLVLVTIITQRINEGASKFITENLASALVPQTNSGLALLDPVTASAQVNTAVDSAFGDFGLPFLNTISIIVVLSLNLVIIQQAFKFVETLIDQSIVQAGQAVGKQVSRNLQNFRKAESFGQGIAMLGKDVYSGASKAITGDNQLLMDAGGAGAKSLNFAGKGIVGANRYIRDADGKNAEARREFNANLKSKGLGAWKGVTNPGKTLASLNNTIQDRAGISGRRINQDMIDDYNKKKLKNGGRALTIEEELRQRERLQIAAKFEKEESEKAKAAGDKNLANANASTDPAIRAQVATLNASEKALEASTKALEDINAKITENKANLEAFQTANGYTDNTEIQDIKPEDLRIMNNLRNVKLDLERDKPAAETLVGTNQALYSSNLTAIRGQVNDDLAKTSSAKLASHLQALDKTNSEGIDAAIAQAEKIGKRSFAGNINRYTENAEKVGGDIDDWARGGKANTKFATDQDFQAALIKQLEELKKTQSNNPPPGP